MLLYRALNSHRMLIETMPVQDKLADIFGLARYAPRR
jgi:hypothetical protein